MKRRRRKDHDVFSLSFLDAISGGFGAIVMLLVIVKVAEPTVTKDRGIGLENTAITLAKELPELEHQIKSQQQQLADAQNLLALVQRDVTRLAPGAAAARKEREASALNARAATTIEQRLAIARQELTAEMLRLQAVRPAAANSLVGGIPVDSEYIIFVIDTSGSMQSIWPSVVRTLDKVLNAYPRVKGIQVMSDMGEYMYSQYAGQWIPDTPGRRRAVLQRMASWSPFSNSSPSEGIVAAIRSFHDPGKRISIYVFGDDFTGASIQSVLNTVASINPRGRDGKPQVRIHGIGFPSLFSMPGAGAGAIRFATLMQSLSSENGGTFVGLPSTR
ncbi:MAG: hypothetical protein Q8L45_07600 [Xanthomonadaceae bacterium]|nr:hypothetical protein [Xanthomonadaceae bacterium]MDP2183966.1 hypothetical protein [Xanthomonadales bacterium]MDZ4116533.1 hypothetical protein [Xanthomonadaceae bacterium]MDZ4376754.1 hypothetical protein [Xanthomonadaceae bacterium]